MTGREYCFQCRVYSNDTDFTGIVHHSNYLRFMERARVEWALENGVDFKKLLADGVAFVIQKAKLHYQRPIHVHTMIEIVARFTEIKKASLHYHQIIRAQEGDTVYCEADLVVACIDIHAKKPIVIPTDVLKELTQHV